MFSKLLNKEYINRVSCSSSVVVDKICVRVSSFGFVTKCKKYKLNILLKQEMLTSIQFNSKVYLLQNGYDDK